jgi:hypothetical protein
LWVGEKQVAFRVEADMCLLRAGIVTGSAAYAYTDGRTQALPASQNPNTVSPTHSGIEMPPAVSIPRRRGKKK